MFPKEIIEILQKYHNNEVLYDINDNISKIIKNLYNINQSLAEQIKNLLLDKDTDNNAQEIMDDSIILRDYIKSIQLLDIENECLNNQTDEISEELVSPIIPKPVKLYLCEDNVCPTCNCSMKDTYTSFTRKMESNLVKKNIETYRCDCCGKFLYAIIFYKILILKIQILLSIKNTMIKIAKIIMKQLLFLILINVQITTIK